MNEEFDNETEAILQAGEELEVAMMVGDYKKANTLINFLEETKKKAEMAIEAKTKSLEDIMVA